MVVWSRVLLRRGSGGIGLGPIWFCLGQGGLFPHLQLKAGMGFWSKRGGLGSNALGLGLEPENGLDIGPQEIGIGLSTFPMP